MADTQLQTANPNAGMASTLGNTTGTSGSSDSGSSLLSDIGGGISSFLNSPLGNLAEFGTLAGLGLSQASSAQSQAASAAGQLTSAGAPFSAAGTGMLGQFTGSNPASVQQQTQAAGTLGDIANTAFTNYQSGKLSPADQASLDAMVTAQKQQVAQQLANSGGTDQSALDSADQQIDSNAMIQKQTLLNNQFQTGQQALTTVQNTYTNLLSNALASSQFGLSALGEGLNLQITQDAQITQSLNALFGQIARGFGTAMAPSGSGGGSGGSSGGAGSTLANAAGKAVGSVLGSGFTLDPSITGTAGAQDAANLASDWAAGNTDAGDLAAASNQQWLDSLGAAPAAAAPLAADAAPAALAASDLAPVGLDAVAPAADTMASEAAGSIAAANAPAASSAGAGLGAGVGAAAAFAPLGITALLASHTGAVQLGDDYWQKYSNPTGSYGAGGNYTQNFLELANGINQGDIPPDYLLQQYPGLYQAAAQMKSLQGAPMSDYWGGSTGNISQNRA